MSSKWNLSLSLACSFIATTTASAATQHHYFYLSADAGILTADFNNSYLDQTDIIPQNISETSTQHGYTGGLAAGYRFFLNETYFLGAELSANLDWHSASFQSGASSTAFSDTTQMKSHADLTFVPGMMLSETVAVYAKLGLSYAALQDHLNSPIGYAPTVMNFNANKNVLGFAGGLGLMKSLTQHVALFTEANYHDYSSASFPVFQNFTATYVHSAHVYAYDVVVGATYKF